MSTTSMVRAGSNSKFAILAAFVVIYVVWGSTFLGIRILVQTLPPLGVAALRFVLSGAILLLLGGAHREQLSARHWLNAFVVGGLFFFGNHSLVGTASRVLPSSVVCLIIATEVPIIALISAITLKNSKLTLRIVLGSALGILGVGSLFIGTGSGEAALPILPCLMVLGASTSWAVGAVVSQRLEGPTNPMLRSGMQMLAGGLLLAVGSVAKGEQVVMSAFTMQTVATLLYMVMFGSVLAFACYTWLLERVPTEAVATHVFVNPLVATALGAWLGNEQIRAAQLLAGLLILASVFVIVYKKKQA